MHDGEGHSALEHVKGKLVKIPHDVKNQAETSQTFDDGRKQYAFLSFAQNLLLANPTKMGVALFDVDEGGDAPKRGTDRHQTSVQPI